MNKKVLVTGGAGFVGSVIVRRLVDMGVNVTVLDNLHTGIESSMPNSKLIKFIKGDVEDSKFVEKIVSEHKLIIHAAAKNIIESTTEPKKDFLTNIGGTLNLLLAAKKYGVEKFVYTSSASIYGNPGRYPVNENSFNYTLTPYSVSKLAGENYCICMYEAYDLPTAVVRYSNVYGIEPVNPFTGVIARFFIAAMSNEPLIIHGDGEQTRDFNYVEDAAEATIETLFNNKSTGSVFNVGTGIETSINQLAKKIIDITGSNSVMQHVSNRDIDKIRRRVVDVEKIRKVLRWEPKYNMEKGLREMYSWYLENI